MVCTLKIEIFYFTNKSFFLINKIPSLILFQAPGTEHSSLISDIFYAEKPHWIFEEPHALKMNYTFKCEFRFQHTHPLIKCMIVKSHSGLIIKLEEPIRALAPGQYAAFYNDQECFGSARILKIGPSMYFTK